MCADVEVEHRSLGNDDESTTSMARFLAGHDAAGAGSARATVRGAARAGKEGVQQHEGWEEELTSAADVGLSLLLLAARADLQRE